MREGLKQESGNTTAGAPELEASAIRRDGENHSASPRANAAPPVAEAAEVASESTAAAETPPTPGGSAPTPAPNTEQSSADVATQAEDPAAHTRATLEKALGQIEAYRDQYMRSRAELENFRKRIAREYAEQLRYATGPLLKALVPILDNLERALTAAREHGGEKSICEGIDLVRRQFLESLGQHGVERIRSVGEQFDPEQHEAMSVRESTDLPDQQIVEEFGAGYTLHGRVIHPAMVVVVRNPQG